MFPDYLSKIIILQAQIDNIMILDYTGENTHFENIGKDYANIW
jgi:hypothetical protein